MSLLDECHGELIQELNQLDELQFYLSEDTHCDNKMAYALDGLTPDENSYKIVSVPQWNSQNCLDWGMSICRKHNLNMFNVDIGSLNNSCGTHLIQSTEQDFCFMLGEQFGPIFYREFQEMKKGIFTDIQNRYSNIEEGYGVDQSKYLYDYMESSPESDAWTPNHDEYDSSQDYDSNQSHFNNSSYNTIQDCFSSNTYGSIEENFGYSQNHYDPTLDTYIAPILLSNSPDHSDVYQNTELYDLDDRFLSNLQMPGLNMHSTSNEVSSDSENVMCNTQGNSPKPSKEKYSKKKDMKYVHVSEDTAEQVTGKIPGLSNRVRQPKCWEFLMHLLVNKETNPDVVRWEDEENYIFRLVRKDKIVELWNKKSEFTSHVYDNFARSLRYHYKRGVLAPVPEKQLVYRCGPKAIEYLNKIRNK